MCINRRYYLTGVTASGDESFLISELSEEAAKETAKDYLKGRFNFAKIKIWSADEEYCEYVLKENVIGQ